MSFYCLNDLGFILYQGEDPDAENLWDRIPEEGPAGSPAGEATRAVSRIVYRYYNDGDRINNSDWFGKETCNPPAGFLFYNTNDEIADLIADLCAHPYMPDGEYEAALYDLSWATRDFITSDPSLWDDEGLDMFDFDIPAEYQYEDDCEDDDEEDWW